MREVLRLMHAAGYAVEGLVHLIKNEKNTRLLLIIAVLTLIICPLLGFTAMQTAMVFFTVILATVAEVLNTAVEMTIDFACEGKFHPKVKIIKDIAAASVLISIINSVTVFSLILAQNLIGR
jgi:diacylglycerol kinase